MLWNDIITLVTQTSTTNSVGDSIPTETLRTVFANRKGVRQNEFYQAMTTGLRPDAMFEVRVIDYASEQVVEHNGKRYGVIRTYNKNGEVMELVCQGLVVDARA